jgi:hypothetical protein
LRTYYDPEFENAHEVQLEVKFTGRNPFEFLYDFLPEKNNAVQPGSFNNIEDSMFSFLIAEPGVYTLKSVSDFYCNGLASFPLQIKVASVPPPTLEVTTTTIEGFSLFKFKKFV